ncbi:MAG: hypothetical protein ACRDHW_20295, partial [Ktedonobacteraceae bacterium]
MKQLQHTHGQEPCIMLTRETIRTLQEALQQFEHTLARVNQQQQTAPFTAATLKQVQGKLHALGQTDGTSVCSFDYNERIVLTAALHLLIVALL